MGRRDLPVVFPDDLDLGDVLVADRVARTMAMQEESEGRRKDRVSGET